VAKKVTKKVSKRTQVKELRVEKPVLAPVEVKVVVDYKAKYESTVAKVQKFLDQCDGHTTKEEIAKVLQSL